LLSQPGTNPGELTFLGALDPITLADTAGSNLVPGYYTMSMVAGVPAVAYRSSNNFYYREATEIDGSAWGSAQLLADLGGNAPPYPSVTDVLGAPAVAWRGGANQGSKIWFSKLR